MSTAEVASVERAAAIRRRPLWTHLLLLALVVLVPQAAAFSFLAYRSADEAQRSVERAARDATERRLVDLEKFLEGSLAAIQTLALTAIPDDLQRLDEKARALVPQRATAISMRDASGQQLINTTVSFGTPLPRTEAQEVIDVDRAVFANGRPSFSRLYMGTVAKRRFILINVPVLRDGQVKYALNAAIDSNDLRSHVFGNFAPGWMGAVLDQDQRVVARAVDQERFVGQRATDDLAAAIRRSPTGSMRSVTLDGSKVFTSFQTSPVTGYTIVVSAPAALVDEPIRRLWRNLILIAGLSLLLSALAAWIWSRQLVGALGLIRMNADALAHERQLAPVRTSVTEFHDLNRGMVEAAKILRQRSSHQRLLIGEMNHRVRNTLAVVLSVVNWTTRALGLDRDANEALTGRVTAIAAAHDLLSREDWGDVSLEDVVTNIAAAHRVDVRISAEDCVSLAPKAVIAITQAFDELLRSGERRDGVEVSWQVISAANHGRILLTWRQKGARRADDVGSRLIELTIARQLEGAVTESADGEGWAWTASIPLKSHLGHIGYVTGGGANPAS